MSSKVSNWDAYQGDKEETAILRLLRRYEMDIRCYLLKKGLIWIGWIFVKKKFEISLYSDSRKEISIKPEANVEYVTLSFSKKWATSRLLKKIDKLKEV